MPKAAADADRPITPIIVGKISGLYGVRGWVKVFSHTQPREQIADYNPWLVQTADGWRHYEVEQGRSQGRGVVVKLVDVDDRDQAAALVGCEIAVERTQFARTGPGEYYWSDLEGLKVVTCEGVELGHVEHLFETGANDVLVVGGDRERLIPFVQGQVIRNIDLAAGRIEVDWDPEF